MATEHSHLCGKKKKCLPHRRKSEWWGVGGRNTKSAEGSCCVRSICQHEVTEVGQERSRISGKEEGGPSPEVWRRLGVRPPGFDTPSLWITPNNILWKGAIGPAVAGSPPSGKVSWLSGPSKSHKSRGVLGWTQRRWKGLGLRHLPTPTLTHAIRARMGMGNLPESPLGRTVHDWRAASLFFSL